VAWLNAHRGNPQEFQTVNTAIDPNLETFIFMTTAIFMEAAPFVLLGSLIAALFETFMSQDRLLRMVSRRKSLQTLWGLGAGLVLPTCECGVVPIVRRFMARGIPPQMAFTYMLAAPVINPLVLLSTYVAFRGDGWMVLGRGFFALVVALAGGTAAALVTQYMGKSRPAPATTPLPMAATGLHHHQNCQCCSMEGNRKERSRFVRVCVLTAQEFLEMSKYLIIGCVVAGLFKAYLWGAWGGFLSMLAGSLHLSVIAMMFMAILLCICSEADAFVAASFWAFGKVPQLAFMAIGSAVDLKLIFAFFAVFGTQTALVLTVVPTIVVYILSILLGTFVW